jgi:hypothetical protein
MELLNYLSAPLGEEPEEGALGVETDWLDVCSFDMRGKRFRVADVASLTSSADALSIQVIPGRYRVLAKVIDYGGDRRVSRFRVCFEGVESHLGAECLETWTDTARIGFCDEEIRCRFWQDDPALNQQLSKEVESGHAAGRALLDPNGSAYLVFCTSGFGDGRYPVRRLEGNGACLGFEIEFIRSGRPYPFPLSDQGVARRHLKAAESGDVAACYAIGECFRTGMGVDQDLFKAFLWLSSAWQHGHATAGYQLGMAYRLGDGVKRDPLRGPEILLEAASMDETNAMVELGKAYEMGDGVAIDLGRASAFYARGVERNNPTAQFLLARMLQLGSGLERDLPGAIRLYQMAVDGGSNDAKCALGLCYLEGEGVA